MARRRTTTGGIGIGWLLTWPLGIVFAAMLFLTVEEIRHPLQGAVPTPAAGPDWQQSFNDRIAIVTKAIEGAKLPIGDPVEEERGSGALRWTHRLFVARLALADKERAEASLAELAKASPGLALSTSPTFDGAEVRFGVDGLLTHTLKLHFEDAAQKPRVAIVLGALGDDLRLARECVGIDAPIALAVRPFRPFSREVAQLGHMFEREIVIDWDETAEIPDASAGDAAGDAFQGRLEDALAGVPHAVGIASGSRKVSASAGRIREALTARGLFFIDAAGAANIATMVVFDQPAEEDDQRMSELLAAARERGRAVAFSRSAPGDIASLLERLRKENVELVPVSNVAGTAEGAPS